MSISILSANNMLALENASLAKGLQLEELMSRAIEQCTSFIQKTLLTSTASKIAILAGSGHNGGDALGIGCQLLKSGHSVTALLCWEQHTGKPLTAHHCAEFEKCGGRIIRCLKSKDIQPLLQDPELRDVQFWIDGLFGFGLNRPVEGINAAAVKYINQQHKPVVAIDIPSGLSCDFGLMDGDHIRATHTLALGALKPAHVDDHALAALGEVHWMDLNLLAEREHISAPRWFAPDQNDFRTLLQLSRRRSESHKYSNGRMLIIAGGKRYPGAALLTCLGAQVSGAGMIHAWVPEVLHSSLLNAVPEIIFENHLPDLNSFEAIVLGPGWVPGNEMVFQSVVNHALKNPQLTLVLDAGAFPYARKLFERGETLAENVILTPHAGEFARLFPEVSARLHSPHIEQRLHRIEAAAWAAQISSATVLLKGARTHIASPDTDVFSLMRSSPLLAHAGQGDVLAGLIGGLAAGGLKSKRAALLAALLQAETALWFSSQNPTALTLPPGELVLQMPHLPHP